MKYIDNEYNKRFGNQKMPNDDFDAEGLWNAISNDLEREQSERRGYIYRKRWMIGIVLIIFLGGMSGIIHYNYVGQDDFQNEIIKTKSTAANKENKPKPFSSDFEKGNPLKFQKATSDKIVASKSTSKKNGIRKELSASKIEPLDFSKQALPVNDTAQFNLSNNSGLVINAFSLFFDVQKRNTKDSPLKIIGRPVVNVVSQLPVKSVFVNSDRPPQLPLAFSENKNLNNKNPKNRIWQLGIMGGVNISRFDFNSDEFTEMAALKDKTENGEWGKSFGINVGLLWKNHWLINSGIEYHQLWRQFKYDGQKNITVFKENKLFKVWVDAVSGDTLNRDFKDTTVNVVLTRNVKHYNEYKQFRIPIEIGIQQNTNKTIYGITAGAVFNFTTAQSGKTFDKNAEIVIFEKSDPTSPFKVFNIGLRVSPILGYRVFENWNITLSPQWMWQRNTDFDGTDFKTGMHLFNLNVGVGYSFR